MVIQTLIIPSVTMNPLDLVDTLLELTSGQEKFRPKAYKLELDVGKYKPESVKVEISDQKLMVSGDRDEKREDGATFEDHFKYSWPLAEDADVEKAEHVVTKGGLLTVRIPIKIPKMPEPRKITIEHTDELLRPQMAKEMEQPECMEEDCEPADEEETKEHPEWRRVPIQLAY